jgi:hypothetical protein
MALRLGVGNWVDGERFFNRDQELQLFTEMLLGGESVSLVAQRRIGKTSLMRETARRLGDKAVSLHVNLEKSHSPEDVVVELSLGAQKHEGVGRRAIAILTELVDQTLGRIESIKASVLSVTLRSNVNEENWQSKGDALFQMLAEIAAQANKHVIVFFDEVPIFVQRVLRNEDGAITGEGRAQADRFLSWLRDNVIRHRGRVVQVLTGSIGLEPVLSQAGLNGALNAYRSFELRPWSNETAAACLMALAQNHQLPLTGGGATQMVDLLGCAIPHHVQMFFDHVYKKYRVDELSGPVSSQLIAEVYETSMTGLRGHPELSHMEERLRLALPRERLEFALSLLTEASTIGHVDVPTAFDIFDRTCPDESKVRHRAIADVLSVLVHDGYFSEQNGVYRFESKLLRDWWKRRFGLGYCPMRMIEA